MCGILIVIDKHRKSLDPAKCRRALHELAFRGPDFIKGQFPRDWFFHGQTVLSLTGDISDSTGGHMLSRSGRFLLSFNGEVYNYHELDQRFLQLGRGKELTDTEVICNLHENMSVTEVPELLDGMFAYVLYDKIKDRITLARDFQGEKSLYVYEDKHLLVISSEIHPLRHLGIALDLDQQVLRDYFHTRHFMQRERTCYRNVRQLLPGAVENLDLSSMNWSQDKIINASSLVKKGRMRDLAQRTLDDLAEELDGILSKCAKEMVPTDRKFAAVLSGGIDSSLLASYAVRHGQPSMLVAVNHVGKDQISHDLVEFGKVLGQQVEVIDVDRSQYAGEIARCQRILGSPLMSHSFVGQQIMSKVVAGRGCKALFGGEGADELFGGYSCYLSVPDKRGAFCPSLYSGYFETEIPFRHNNTEHLKDELSAAWNTALDAYASLDAPQDHLRQASLFCDFSHQVSSVAMRGADLMSMMWSLETRSIFVRRPVVEFALNLPMWAKADREETDPLLQCKRVLKKVFLRHFPRSLLVQKQGFSGFPNESQAYLGDFTDFLAIDALGVDRQRFNSATITKAAQWKLINVEHFLRHAQL
jgi:asparagine synthase (glutamine-hydrolysing)